jgi:hypothetical protein
MGSIWATFLGCPVQFLLDPANEPSHSVYTHLSTIRYCAGDIKRAENHGNASLTGE